MASESIISCKYSTWNGNTEIVRHLKMLSHDKNGYFLLSLVETSCFRFDKVFHGTEIAFFLSWASD